MPRIDWFHLFAFSVSPLELILRGTLIYLFLFCLFRFFVHRDVGGLGLSDLLVLVIIADAAQNAMADDYKSVTDGMVLIGTIIGWSALINYLSFHYVAFRHIALPNPLCLVDNGVKMRRNMRQELITDEELDEMLREHEIEDISQIKRAYLEPDGQLTVIRKRSDGGPAASSRHRPPGD